MKSSKLLATIQIVNLIAVFVAAGVGFCATSARDSAELAKATYIYIATVRKDGNQSKAVPVWFITTSDNQILIETGPASWKARRIKRGSPVLVWIGSRTGSAFIGRAEVVQDKKLQDLVIEQYP